jgi:hypothetical protein
MLVKFPSGERLIACGALAPNALRILIYARNLCIDPDCNVSDLLRRQPFSGKMPLGVETERTVEVLPVHVRRVSLVIRVIATQVV